MSMQKTPDINSSLGMQIRVRGLVQGVGFRPFVWQAACEFEIKGSVLNDSFGVLIDAWGKRENLDAFIEKIKLNNLPLARVDSIECSELSGTMPSAFQIKASVDGITHTSIAPEAATCLHCQEDIFSPANRRFRYAFTNCTHCGPRLSIIKSVPYDRCNTSMAEFELCSECKQEYENPADRRYHAQANACAACGPRLTLRKSDEASVCSELATDFDAIKQAFALLLQGEIIAVKGLGGFQLCCDATNNDAVTRLRQRKMRYEKPFALMAKDLNVINRYCYLSEAESSLLSSSRAPIVLLEARPSQNLSTAVAPRVGTLGFMLPNTPLHHLLFSEIDFPLVFTSGNRSDEPQSIANSDAQAKLGHIADYFLEHNRDITNRVDDSVLRVVANVPRLIRRARAYAPAEIALPPGFNASASNGILAMGAELKNTLCLIKDGAAILTQHIGDLEDATTFEDYKNTLSLYQNLFQHSPSRIVVDKHPEYLSTKYGKQFAESRQLQLLEVQHHHAHIAACLAENTYPLDAPKLLGVALDGLGYGDGEFWGAEFLYCNYTEYQRLGTFKPVALIGGTKAMLEPWRNTYAHIVAGMGWTQYKMNFDKLELTAFLESKPIDVMAAMLKSKTNVPVASSCGRLFDAVAAAIGVCREEASYEGQAAIELESLVDKNELYNGDDTLSYPFSIGCAGTAPVTYIEPLEMWWAILRDLANGSAKGIMAARFHKGLANAVLQLIRKLANVDDERRVNTVALSGGVFQNKILLELLIEKLEKDKFRVLTHSKVPANDGSIALGQAIVCAAQACMSQ